MLATPPTKTDLEQENTRLQRLVAELLVRNQQLRQALGDFLPRVEFARNIRVQPELVAAIGQNLATRFLVEKRCQRPIIVYFKSEFLGL